MEGPPAGPSALDWRFAGAARKNGRRDRGARPPGPPAAVPAVRRGGPAADVPAPRRGSRSGSGRGGPRVPPSGRGAGDRPGAGGARRVGGQSVLGSTDGGSG